MQTNTSTEATVIEAIVIEDTVDRYLVMFNEADDAVRSELAHAVWVDDGRLVDPLIDAVGPEQIAAAIGGLRDQMPGHSLTRTTVVDAHHDLARSAGPSSLPTAPSPLPESTWSPSPLTAGS